MRFPPDARGGVPLRGLYFQFSPHEIRWAEEEEPRPYYYRFQFSPHEIQDLDQIIQVVLEGAFNSLLMRFSRMRA